VGTLEQSTTWNRLRNVVTYFKCYFTSERSWESSVYLVTRLHAGTSFIRISPGATSYRPALGPTQPLFSGYQGHLPWG